MHLLEIMFMFLVSIFLGMVFVDRENRIASGGDIKKYNARNMVTLGFILIAAVLFVSACFVAIF